MPNYLLFIKLIGSSLSFRKNSYHFVSFKRLAFIFLGVPALFVLILINQIFMLLDNIIFLPYRWIKVKKCIFITGVPRSGTTYLFNILALGEQSTCFKLWEIVFAPSIIQKFIALFIIKIDRIIGKPLYRFSKFLDVIMFSKFQNIHPLSWSKPEEDEPLMIFDLSSLYLFYAFPESKALEPFLKFDNSLPEKTKKHIMNYYYRCVQRHLFVFDPFGKKQFISKNPAFTSKIQSVCDKFPKARFLYLLRSPEETLPSFISLNEHIFKRFMSIPKDSEMDKKATKLIIDWYNISLNNLKNLHCNFTVISYQKLIINPLELLEKTYLKVGLGPTYHINRLQKEFISKNKGFKSRHLYDKERGLANQGHTDLKNVIRFSEFLELI